MIALLYARRCKKLEQMPCSAAVLQSVGMQAIVTEFLIKNADTLFSDAAQNGTNDVTAGQLSDVSDTRIVLPSCKYYWSIIICPPLHGHPGWHYNVTPGDFTWRSLNANVRYILHCFCFRFVCFVLFFWHLTVFIKYSLNQCDFTVKMSTVISTYI